MPVDVGSIPISADLLGPVRHTHFIASVAGWNLIVDFQPAPY